MRASEVHLPSVQPERISKLQHTRGILPLGDFDELLDVADFFRLHNREGQYQYVHNAKWHELTIVGDLEVLHFPTATSSTVVRGWLWLNLNY